MDVMRAVAAGDGASALVASEKRGIAVQERAHEPSKLEHRSGIASHLIVAVDAAEAADTQEYTGKAARHEAAGQQLQPQPGSLSSTLDSAGFDGAESLGTTMNSTGFGELEAGGAADRERGALDRPQTVDTGGRFPPSPNKDVPLRELSERGSAGSAGSVGSGGGRSPSSPKPLSRKESFGDAQGAAAGGAGESTIAAMRPREQLVSTYSRARGTAGTQGSLLLLFTHFLSNSLLLILQ